MALSRKRPLIKPTSEISEGCEYECIAVSDLITVLRGYESTVLSDRIRVDAPSDIQGMIYIAPVDFFELIARLCLLSREALPIVIKFMEAHSTLSIHLTPSGDVSLCDFLPLLDAAKGLGFSLHFSDGVLIMDAELYDGKAMHVYSKDSVLAILGSSLGRTLEKHGICK